MGGDAARVRGGGNGKWVRDLIPKEPTKKGQPLLLVKNRKGHKRMVTCLVNASTLKDKRGETRRRPPSYSLRRKKKLIPFAVKKRRRCKLAISPLEEREGEKPQTPHKKALLTKEAFLFPSKRGRKRRAGLG